MAHVPPQLARMAGAASGAARSDRLPAGVGTPTDAGDHAAGRLSLPRPGLLEVTRATVADLLRWTEVRWPGARRARAGQAGIGPLRGVRGRRQA